VSPGEASSRVFDGPALRLVRVVLLSAAAGALYALLNQASLVFSALSGACTGGLLAFLEIYVLGGWARAAMLRLPFSVYFLLRVGLYVAGVLAVNVVALPAASGGGHLLERRDLAFAFLMCVAVNLLFAVNDLLGPGVLFAFSAGRYRRPRREERVLLYIDLRGSTALAERLGEARFLDLLNAVFADVTAEIVACGGEIHKYVGDEVIAVWRAGTDPQQPIHACLAARRRLLGRAGAYAAAFGETPDFRAAIHAGPVVIGELGAQKKEIALIGDAMNTAARILEVARETGAAVLISAPYYERMTRALVGVAAERLAPAPLRGKLVPLSLISLKEERGGLSAVSGPS
jgi:adenylate cyclase